MAPNLIDMAPFLVEYAGLKYLTKFYYYYYFYSYTRKRFYESLLN